MSTIGQGDTPGVMPAMPEPPVAPVHSSPHGIEGEGVLLPVPPPPLPDGRVKKFEGLLLHEMSGGGQEECPSDSMLLIGLPLPKAYRLPVNGSADSPASPRAPSNMSREANWFRPGS